VEGGGILILQFSSKVEHTSKQHILTVGLKSSRIEKNVEKLSGKALL
jgi:hypothetical protein